MKKIFFVVFATFLLSSSGWSQYGVYHEGSCGAVSGSSVDISGGVYSENNIPVGESVEVKLYFKNMSGSTQIVSVKRTKINVPSVWTGTMCWLTCNVIDTLFEGGCYDDAQMLTNPWTCSTITIQNDSVAELKNDYDVVDIEGGGLYRYHFMSGNTILDSVDVHINATAAVDELESDFQASVSAYPNPASSEVLLNTVGLSNDYSVRVTDVLGKVVYADEAGAIKKIDISNFKNGVYLISVSEKGEAIQTRRIVVKH